MGGGLWVDAFSNSSICFAYFVALFLVLPFFLASYLRNAQNLPVKYGHASERALNNLFTGTSKSYDPAMIPKYLNLGF